MRQLIALAFGLAAISGCAVTPKAVPAGQFQTGDGISLPLGSEWSHWAPQINGTLANGHYLTKDGPLLNRIHLASIEDGEPFVRARRNADVPRFVDGASELELVDFVTASLERIGYSGMEALEIRPAGIDGAGGVRFALAGTWENGAKVRGDAAVAVKNGVAHLAIYMAPALHYYEASAAEVDAAFSRMTLSG